MKELRFGILGCASIAKKYAISSIKKVGKLVAVASRDINKSKEWAKEYNCEAETYESLLLRKDIDAVYIPLPIGMHKEWVIKAANAKKHILCEKALAGQYREVKEMVEAAEKNKVLLFENYMVDYHPQHKEVLEIIKKDEIGKLRLFSSNFCFPPFKEDNIRYKKELGGGALNDGGGYIVFMARKIFDEEPEVVTCKLNNKNYDVDLEGSIMLEFKEGKTALGFFGFDDFYQNNYQIIGTEGKISVGRAYSIPPELKPEVIVHKQNNKEEINVESANQFDKAFKEFAEKVDMNKDYKKLLSQAKVMEALRISARENRKVLISELR